MVYSAIAGGVGEGAGLGLGKLANPFAKRITPEVGRLMEKMKLYGTSFTPAQATGSFALGSAETFLGARLTSGGIMRDFAEKQGIGMTKFADDLVDHLGPRMTPQKTGELFFKALDNSRDTFDLASKIKKRTMNRETAGAAVNTDIVTRSAKKLFNKLVPTDPVTGKPLSRTLQSKTATKIIKEFSELPPVIPFEQAFTQRSDLLTATKAKVGEEIIPGKLKGVMKQMVKRMDQAIMHDSTLTPAGKAAFRDLGAFWTVGKAQFNRKFIRSLTAKEPENIGEAIFSPRSISAAPGSQLSRVQQVKELVDPGTWQKMTQGALRGVLTPNPSTGIIEGTAVGGRLAAMGDEVLGEMFSPAHQRDIQDFALALTRSQLQPEGGVGGTLVRIAYGGLVLGGAYGGYRQEGIPGGVVGGGAVLLSPAILAKIMVSRVGLKWLTEGLVTSRSGKEAINLSTRLLALIGKENLYPVQTGSDIEESLP